MFERILNVLRQVKSRKLCLKIKGENQTAVSKPHCSVAEKSVIENKILT